MPTRVGIVRQAFLIFAVHKVNRLEKDNGVAPEIVCSEVTISQVVINVSTFKRVEQRAQPTVWIRLIGLHERVPAQSQIQFHLKEFDRKTIEVGVGIMQGGRQRRVAAQVKIQQR